jgi:asparagine synthase (glutamine-hydrolysing)
MRYLEPDIPIHTFTFISPGAASDEEYWADLVNTEVKAIPHKIKLDAQDLEKDIKDLIKTQGEPFGSTSIYAQYKVFQEVHKCGIKVTLDGQGADELLAGYDGYPSSRIKSLIENKSLLSSINFTRQWAKFRGQRKRDAIKVFASALVPKSFREPVLTLFLRKSVPPWLKRDVLASHNVKLTYPDASTYDSSECKGRRLASALRAALTSSGLAQLLRHGDRNSMRWSVESRVPFLTIDLAEFLLSLPESYLVSSKGTTKYLFREAMRGIVPDIILDRRDKIGFETPEKDWLLKQQENITMWLNSAQAVSFIDSNEIQNFVDNSLQKPNFFDYSVWRLVNFCIWLYNLKSNIV